MLELLEELRGMAATTEAGVKEWQHEAAANDLAVNRLTTHLTSAKADLSMYIEEEMASAARRGAGDSTQFKADFLSALKSAYQRWATKHEAEIQKFLREADRDSQTRWERPSFEDVTKSWKDAPTKNDQVHHPSKDGSPPVPVSKIAKAVHKAFRELQEIRVGMPLGRAEEELRRLKSAGSFEKYLSQVKGTSLLKDIKHAEIVENAVQLTKFLDVAVPVLIELGPLLGECLGDEIAARKRQAERERIRLHMAENAANFEKETWRQWCEEGVPGAAVKSLNEQRRRAEELAEKLRLDLEDIKRTIEGLESLLLESGYNKGS
jgi:hypothetical protein